MQPFCRPWNTSRLTLLASLPAMEEVSLPTDDEYHALHDYDQLEEHERAVKLGNIIQFARRSSSSTDVLPTWYDDWKSTTERTLSVL